MITRNGAPTQNLQVNSRSIVVLSLLEGVKLLREPDVALTHELIRLKVNLSLLRQFNNCHFIAGSLNGCKMTIRNWLYSNMLHLQGAKMALVRFVTVLHAGVKMAVVLERKKQYVNK